MRRRQRINISFLARHDTSCDTLEMPGMQEFYFWHAVDPSWSGAGGTFVTASRDFLPYVLGRYVMTSGPSR